MGNLLAYQQSFDWTDRKIDRGAFIENLSSAIDKAGEHGDNIYKTPDLHNILFPWGQLLATLANSCYDLEIFRHEFPWITQIQYQTLMGISYIFQVTTPGESKSFEGLVTEFPNGNNALIGIEIASPCPLVFDVPSWNEFHSAYVSTFSFKKQCENYGYFITFYKPYLKLKLGLIRKLISTNSAHPFIRRIDVPRFEHDNHHIHLNDARESALNIDGSWRHGGCAIPKQACETLSVWGFKLPKECYNRRDDAFPC